MLLTLVQREPNQCFYPLLRKWICFVFSFKRLNPRKFVVFNLIRQNGQRATLNVVCDVNRYSIFIISNIRTEYIIVQKATTAEEIHQRLWWRGQILVASLQKIELDGSSRIFSQRRFYSNTEQLSSIISAHSADSLNENSENQDGMKSAPVMRSIFWFAFVFVWHDLRESEKWIHIAIVVYKILFISYMIDTHRCTDIISFFFFPFCCHVCAGNYWITKGPSLGNYFV